MPIKKNSTYQANGLLKNGHINSLFTYLYRNLPPVPFIRERVITPDDDFIDMDLYKQDAKKAVFLFHGLEGNSTSQYMQGTSHTFYDHGYDVIAMNYRGCSGEDNKHLRSYHSGNTPDVHLIIEKYIDDYDQVALVGFSLGGNKVLKYSADGIYNLSSKIKAVCAISAPVDLHSCCLKIGTRQNFIYQHKFLSTLLAKAKIKAKKFPNQIHPSTFDKIKTLYDFDEYFTGPVHGFKDAADYYDQCNSLQFIHNIHIPTLLINALDDPFLTKKCFPYNIADQNPSFFLEAPKYGGHCGFYTKGKSYYWDELEILSFVENYINE